MNLKAMVVAAVAAIGCWCHAGLAADLPNPKSGGSAGGPISLLVLTRAGECDAKYEAELTKAGFKVTNASRRKKRTCRG